MVIDIPGFKKAIADALQDVKDIEVITAVAEEVDVDTDSSLTTIEQLRNAKLQKVSYYAKSVIQLEGDNYMILPSGPDSEITKQVTEIHKQSTQNAVKTWNNMARVAFTGLAIAADLANDSLKKDTLKLISQFGIINKTD